MGTATTIGLIAAGIVAIGLVAAVVSKLVLRLMKRPLEARIAALYRPDEILLQDLAANSFGLESKGTWQVRGNGGLVLSGDTLHFFQFIPERELRIPVEAITELSFTRRHLGKATIHELLKVQFSTDSGPDSIAWYLTEPKTWKHRIEKLREGWTASARR